MNYMARDLGSSSRANQRIQEEISVLENPNLSHMVIDINVGEIRLHLAEKPQDPQSKEVVVGIALYMKYSLIGLINEILLEVKELPEEQKHQGRDWGLLKGLGIDFKMIAHPDFSSLYVYTHPLSLVLTYKEYTILMGVMNCYSETTRQMTERGEELEDYNTGPKPITKQPTAKSSTIGGTPWYMDIDVGGMRVVLKSDFKELPNLLEFYVSSLGMRGLYPTEIKTIFFVSARYYNLVRAFWEPLIEPCELKFHYKSNIRGDVWITLKTPPVTEVNVTAAMGKTLTFWSEESKSGDEYYPIVLRNFTSKKLQWNLPLVQQKLEGTIEPGCTAPIQVNFTDVKDLAEFAETKLDIKLDHDFKLNKLAILDQSVALFNMKKNSTSVADKLIYDITFKENRRLITVRSVVRIINKSKTALELCAELSPDGKHSPTNTLRYNHPKPVMPGGDASVPSEYVEAGSIFFRPVPDNGGNYTWSNGVDCTNLQPSRIDLGYQYKSGGQKYYLRCDVHGDHNAFSTKMFTFYVTDPLTIDNLLPCDLEYQIIGTEFTGTVESQKVKAVNDSPATAYATIRIKIPDSEYSLPIQLDLEEGSFHVPMQTRDIELFYERSPHRGSSLLTIYAKHWIVNRSEFRLHLFESKSNRLTNKDGAKVETTLQPQRPIKEWKPEWYDLDTINKAEPFIFSTMNKKLTGGRVEKAYIQINDSDKSEDIRFDVIDAGELQIFDTEKTRCFRLGIHVKLADGKMKRTKIVTITPRIVLINNMGRKLFFKQVDTEEVHCIENQKFVPYHFLTIGKEQISISFEQEEGWSWSGGLEITTIGETYLKLTHLQTNIEYFVRVDISMQNNSIFSVQFNPKKLGIFPYRIENQTRQRITIWQTENDQFSRVINPGDHLNYAWDEPSKPRFLQLQFDDVNKPFQVSLDRVEYNQFPGSIYAGEVTIESKTRILWIKDYRSHMSVIDRQARDKSEENEVKTMIKIVVPQIGISIVDPHPKELLFISMEGMALEYDTSASKTSINVKMQHLQVDNQLFMTPFPVMLVPKPNPDKPNFLEMSYRQSNVYETVQFIDGFMVNVQKIELCIDAAMLNSLLFLQQSVMASETTNIEDQSICIQRDDIKKPMYLKLFFISPIAAEFSFTYPAYKAEKEDLLKLWVSPLIGSVPSIDRSSLVLKPIYLEHPVYEENQLIQVLQTHYINTAIRESYKLVGAVDLVANPFRFVGTVAEGVKDLLVTGPQKAMGKSASAREHEQSESARKEEEEKEKKRQHAREAAPPEYQRALETFERVPGFRQTIGEGFWELGHGFATGVTGVVRDPIKGAKKDGPVGMVTGVAKGLFGIIKKPAHGIHVFGGKAAKAVVPNARAEDDQTHRRRLPRYFGNSRILEPYNLDMAYGQFVLVVISGAAYADEDCMHNLIVDDKLYLVTDFRVVCINIDDFSIRWQISHKNIVKIVKEYPKIILDEGRDNYVCDSHHCEFLEDDCNCQIPQEAKTGRRFLIDSTEREFPLLWASLFKSWSFWHRIATPPELQFEVQQTGSEQLSHQNFIKRELVYFGAMDLSHKIDLVDEEKFTTHVPAGDKQETQLKHAPETNSKVYNDRQ